MSILQIVVFQFFCIEKAPGTYVPDAFPAPKRINYIKKGGIMPSVCRDAPIIPARTLTAIQAVSVLTSVSSCIEQYRLAALLITMPKIAIASAMVIRFILLFDIMLSSLTLPPRYSALLHRHRAGNRISGTEALRLAYAYRILHQLQPL